MNGSLKVKDHSVSNEDFTLTYDEKYHMYFTEPKPAIENLPAYYESEDYISHTDGKRSFFEIIYQQIKIITLSRKRRLLTQYHPNRGSVLDIGAGTGDFLEHLLKNNWEASGIEPSLKARELAKQKNLRVLSEVSELRNTSFDVITMWHVLEHVYDLKGQIEWFKNHLKERGTLIIAVPNFESWDAHYYKSFWAAYDVPRHLYHFSKKAISLLFEEAGFKLIEILPMKFDAYYVSLLSEKYKTGKMNYVSAFRSGAVSNWKARRSKNYSSHIYVLKHNLD